MSQQPSAASWVKLPAAVVLVACEFLDAASLGRLEICGKTSLGDKARAWREKAAGVTRGNLAQLSNKQLLAAQARVQALIPSSPGGVVGFANNVRRWSEDVPFDEFSFTVVLSWECGAGLFLDGGLCSPCIDHCDECDDATTCSVCATDYDLEDNNFCLEQ